MFPAPHLNINGKAMDLVLETLGVNRIWASYLSPLILSAYLLRLLWRLWKLMYSKILTPSHWVDGLMFMSLLVYLSDSGKSTKTFGERRDLLSSTTLRLAHGTEHDVCSINIERLYYWEITAEQRQKWFLFLLTNRGENASPQPSKKVKEGKIKIKM